MIPWATLIPHPGYFWTQKVLRTCPEIRHLEHKRRLSLALDLLKILPWVIVLIIPQLIILLGDWLDRNLDRVWRPTFGAKAHGLIWEIYDILPASEIHRRANETPH